jgi:hypothetical protein
MATLTALSASHGFVSGDLDTSGQVALQAAYQRMYFADGREYSATIADSGYHKLDMINTRLVGVASGAFTAGEVVTQATSGATGIYGELVTRAGPIYWHMVYRTSTTEFDATNVVTGSDSSETLTPSAVAAPPHWLNWTLTDGEFPDGGSNILSLCWGRVFMNSVDHPHQWFCTRVGDPLDLLLVADDVASPQNSQATTSAGLVGDQLIALIPYKGNMQVFGCLNTMYVMRADPAKGGSFTTLSDTTGIFSNTSYCWDDKNNLFFIGSDGVYVMSASDIIDGNAPQNITKENVPRLLSAMGLNRRTDRVAMAYDKDRYGIAISATQLDGAWNASFWLDLRTGGVFPDVFNSSHYATSMLYLNARRASDRKLLFGCQDGYVRTWDEGNTGDDGETIESLALYSPLTSQNVKAKVKIREMSVEVGEDTDSVTVGVFAKDTASEVVEAVQNGAAPKIARTVTTHGSNPSMRNVAHAGAVGIVLSNTSASSGWTVESVAVEAAETGKVK